MSRPAVTVVVPTHNRPEMMAEAVQSVADQEYDGPIEIVVVFDASEPHDPAVTLGQDRTIVLTRNDRTRGLAGARNSGILVASNELVAFLDDDDYWLPGKLEGQVAVFDIYPETLLVGTAMRIDDGRSFRDRLVPTDVVSRADLISDRLAALHSSSFLFRRRALVGDTAAVGLIDELLPGSYGEDYDILLRTARVSTIRVVNEPLVSVRWSGQSYFFGQWLLYATALQYLLAKHPDFADNSAATSRVQSQIAFALAASDHPADATAWARRSLALRRTNVKAMLAIAVAKRIVSADRVLAIVRKFGKGI